MLALLCATPVTGADDRPEPTTTGNASDAHLVSVYPNPVADGDRGEFVVVSVPPGTNLGEYAVGDDERTVQLPNRTASARTVLSMAPNATADLVGGDPIRLPDALALANGGEPVTLSRNGTVIDRLNYTDAPSGAVRVAEGADRWRALGATDRLVVHGGSGTVTAFTLPDAPTMATDTLAGADRRILFAGYTFTDRSVADELLTAADRNVTVRVLVDGDPVGGMTNRQATILDRLTDAGIEVRVLGGDHARYDYHHAKYAVVDDRTLVTTENWKRAGVGGNGSRGWGVVTDQPRIVEGLAETFRADAGWHDARPWAEYRSDESFEREPAANATFRPAFDPQSVPVEETRLLVAPDNAEQALRSLIGNATESLDVQQVSIGSRGQPFVQSTLAAARRGVRVRVLLSSAWYVEEENKQLVGWLNERASDENLPLTARLAQPRGRFKKIHSKGVIVDGDQVVVGSMNWNNNSARDNREVALVLDGEAVGAYYQRVFEADWPVPPPLPVGVVVGTVLAVLIAAWAGSRVAFEPEQPPH